MDTLKAAVLVSDTRNEQALSIYQWIVNQASIPLVKQDRSVFCLFLIVDQHSEIAVLCEFARQHYPSAIRILVGKGVESASTDQVLAHLSIDAFEDDRLGDVEKNIHLLASLNVPKDMRRWLCQMDSVPVIKGVYLSLINALRADEPDLDQIIECIGKDQFLLMRVLQSANSSQFSGAKSVYDVRQAVMRIGLERLYYLVVVVGVFSSTTDLDEYKRGLALSTAFDVAYWSQLISLQMGLSRELSDSAYLAGLLHNLGQTLVHEKELASLNLDSAFQLSTCESQAGAFWLALWGMPSNVVKAVANQYDQHLSFKEKPITSAISIGRSIETSRMSGAPTIRLLEQYHFDQSGEEQKLHGILEALEDQTL
jgi:HD-like signal output (HDOD) protein